MADKALDLRGLKNQIAGTIQLDDEHTHVVLKLNGEQYQLLTLEGADEATAVAHVYQVAGECVPSLGLAGAKQLHKDVIKAIITLAGQGIEAVEALFPNVKSPESGNSTSPG